MITNVFMAKQQATDLIWQQQGEFSDKNDREIYVKLGRFIKNESDTILSQKIFFDNIF